MNPLVIMAIGLFILSVVSGMLGLGVAFSAVPFLGLFLPDLVHQVQPLSLLLNGITALFAVFGYVLIRFGCEPAPMILGFILGPLMEENLRRALVLSRGDPMVFIQRPISAILLAMTLVAGHAAPDPFLRKLHQFGLDPFALKFTK